MELEEEKINEEFLKIQNDLLFSLLLLTPSKNSDKLIQYYIDNVSAELRGMLDQINKWRR